MSSASSESTRVLHVVGSPKGDASASTRIARAFLGEYQDRHPDHEITTLDVWSADLPRFGRNLAIAKLAPLTGEARTAEQEAEWQRTKASDVMANWLASGIKPDVVFANNDEMALGAIQALKGAGVSMDDVIVAGVDATADALKSMEQGDLDVTVFQDAVGQAEGGVNAAIAMIGGEEQPSYVDIPFIAVTPENMADFK